MKRLVAFGCSHTYGYGLPDIANPNIPHDFSKMAWPSILSEKLEVQLVNKAYPGWSNQRILYEILNFDFLTSDLAITLWATIDRDVLFQDNGTEFQVGCWNNDDITKQYYKLHSDFDLAMTSLTAIHHADTVLKVKGITCKHFLYTNRFYPVVAQVRENLRWFNTDLEYVYLPGLGADKAADNVHYGVETHRALANHIMTFLT